MAGYESKDGNEAWHFSDSWRRLVSLDGRFFFNGEKHFDPLRYEGLLGRMAISATMRWERDGTEFIWRGARAAVVGRTWSSMLFAQEVAADGTRPDTIGAMSYRPQLYGMPVTRELRFPTEVILDGDGQLAGLSELYRQQEIALMYRRNPQDDRYSCVIGNEAANLQLLRNLELGVQYFQGEQQKN